MEFKPKLVLFIIKQGILFSCWTQYAIILNRDSIEEYPWELHFWDPVIEIESIFEMHSIYKSSRGNAQKNDNVWKT